jgi:hypothetical protein
MLGFGPISSRPIAGLPLHEADGKPVDAASAIEALPLATWNAPPVIVNVIEPPPADPALEREIFEYAIRDDVEARRRSVQTNRVAIVLSVASLIVLIDEKLESLRYQRPNDADAQAARNEAIAQYERLKQDVQALQGAVLQVEEGEAQERSLESASNAFVRGVQDWWDKAHEKICDKAYDAAIFLSCLGVCSHIGAEGSIAVAVSGALVGGKTIVAALKTLPKRTG